MNPLATVHAIDLVGDHEVVRGRVCDRAREEEVPVRGWDSYEELLTSLRGDQDSPLRQVVLCAVDGREIPSGWMRRAVRDGGRTRVVVLAPTLGDRAARDLVLEGAAAVHGLPLPVMPLREWFALDTFLQTIYAGALECERTEIHRLRIPSQREWVAPVIRHLCQRLDTMGYPDEVVRSVFPLVVDEAVTNAMEHGHGWNSDLVVEVEATLSPQGFRIVVQDQGPGFRRELVRDPLVDENLSREGGRGLFLMESLVDEVRYEDRGRRVILVGGDLAQTPDPIVSS